MSLYVVTNTDTGENIIVREWDLDSALSRAFPNQEQRFLAWSRLDEIAQEELNRLAFPLNQLPQGGTIMPSPESRRQITDVLLQQAERKAAEQPEYNPDLAHI